MSSTKKKPTIETLKDGRDVVVTFQDGTEETVFVKKISWRKHELFLSVAGNLDAEILLFTGKTDTFLDRLDEESYWRLHEVGRELNPSLERTIAAYRPFMKAGAELAAAQAGSRK